MKYYFISAIIHLTIFLSFYNFFSYSPKPGLKIEKIQVSLLNTNSNSSNNSSFIENIEVEVESKHEIIKNIESKKLKIKKIEKIEKIEHKEKKINKENKSQETNISKNISLAKNIDSEQGSIGSLKNLIQDSSGNYIGDIDKNADIFYKIIKEVPPKYPNIAKKIGYKKEVIIKTKFLIGLNGKIEKIIFLDDFISYGFQDEVKKSIESFEFEPILYKGKKIKLYFYKDYKFNSK